MRGGTVVLDVVPSRHDLLSPRFPGLASHGGTADGEWVATTGRFGTPSGDSWESRRRSTACTATDGFRPFAARRRQDRRGTTGICRIDLWKRPAIGVR